MARPFGVTATAARCTRGERDLIRWTGFLVSEVADSESFGKMPNTKKSLSAT